MMPPRFNPSRLLLVLFFSVAASVNQAPATDPSTGEPPRTSDEAAAAPRRVQRLQLSDVRGKELRLLSWRLKHLGSSAEIGAPRAWPGPGQSSPTGTSWPLSGAGDPSAAMAEAGRVRKRLSIAPPSPTPTPTPTPLPTPNPVVAPSTMASETLAALGRIGVTSPSLDSLVSTALTTGVQALVDLAVTAEPGGARSHIANGLRWDFEDGYTNAKGTLTGTVDLTYGSVQHSGNTIEAQAGVQSSNFTKGGMVRPYDHATGTISAQQRPNGTTTGSVALTGGGTFTYAEDEDETVTVSLPLSGSVQFDTAQCARYPIGGSVTTDYSPLLEQPEGFLTGSVGFTDSCDGTFQFSGPVEVLVFPPVIAGEGCELGWFGALWADILSVTWDGNTFEGSVDRTVTDDDGVVQLDRTTITGSLSADGQTVAALQVDSYIRNTYPEGYWSCPGGGCTRERWTSTQLATLPRAGVLAFFDTYGGSGTAFFTSWSDRVVGAGWPDPAKNTDCTYPLDTSDPDNGAALALLVRP